MKTDSIYTIDKLIVIDKTGMPAAPTIRQLLDKDVLTLYNRDTSKDKSKYLKECGVIYYLGDPKSPAMQQGLSYREAVKLAIENFDLPKNYVPDELVLRIKDKYYRSNITEAGVAIENLNKSLHLASLSAKKINEFLNQALSDSVSKEEIPSILSLIGQVRDTIKDIPTLTKSLATAYENLQSEEEKLYARGGGEVLSSMRAEEGE